jgi:hypothetical protein
MLQRVQALLVDHDAAVGSRATGSIGKGSILPFNEPPVRRDQLRVFGISGNMCASHCLMNAGPTSSQAGFSCTSQSMRGNRSDAFSSSSELFACVLRRLIMRPQAASSPYVQRNMTKPHFFSGFARRSACTSSKCGDIVLSWYCRCDMWWKTIGLFERAVLEVNHGT